MRRSGRRLRLHVGYLQRIVKLCLITAQRIGEVAGMVPAELDLKAREWRLPGSRIKNANAHVVPLSDLALEIIKEAAADGGEGCADISLWQWLRVPGRDRKRNPALSPRFDDKVYYRPAYRPQRHFCPWLILGRTIRVLDL
ncbi:MAG: tyrosine-type recombinase/integrase [Pseudolabrys sp.]